MKRGLYLVLLLFFLLGTSSSFAQSEDNVLITLYDEDTNQKLNDLTASVKINNYFVTEYVTEDNKLSFTIEDGSYEAYIYANDPSTPGEDYYKKVSLLVSDSIKEDVFLSPAASMRGIVKDKYDNIISDADLQFDCDFYFDFPSKTSKLGTFSLMVIPTGNCRIVAGFQAAIGVKEVVIEQGELYDIELVLDKNMVDKKSRNYFWWILALFVIVLSYFYLKKKKKTKEPKEKSETKNKHGAVHQKPSFKLGKRGRDIYKTLKEREKQIVDFLLTQTGYATQSKIRQELGIAKSSLFRTIESLEVKNVITTQKHLNSRRIKLSDWFLDDEK